MMRGGLDGDNTKVFVVSTVVEIAVQTVVCMPVEVANAFSVG